MSAPKFTPEAVERGARALWDLRKCCDDCWPDVRATMIAEAEAVLKAATA